MKINLKDKYNHSTCTVECTTIYHKLGVLRSANDISSFSIFQLLIQL